MGVGEGGFKVDTVEREEGEERLKVREKGVRMGSARRGCGKVRVRVRVWVWVHGP